MISALHYVPLKIHGSAKRTRRSVLSVIASATNLCRRTLVRFLVTPFIVSSVGTGYYGIWEICRQLIVQMGAAEGRSIQALKWTLANKQGSDDFSAKRRDVGSAVQVWALFLPLIVLVGLLLVWKGPSLVGQASPEMVAVARLAIAILVLNRPSLPC